MSMHACVYMSVCCMIDYMSVQVCVCVYIVHVSTFVIILSNIIVIVTCEGGFPIP